MSKKILAVDDERSVLEFMKAKLGEHGYDVVGASDGHECLRLLESDNFDLVILDYKMAAMEGDSVFLFIRTVFEKKLGHDKDSKLPIIIHTGENDLKIKDWFQKAKVQGYVEKDTGLESLLRAVDDILKKNNKEG